MRKRNILTLILIIAAVIIQCSAVFGAIISENKQWFFPAWDDITVNTVADEYGLTIKGWDNGQTYVYNGTLTLGRNGSTSKSCIMLRPKGSCRLFIRVKSGTYASNIAMSDGSRVFGTVQATNSYNTLECDYIGPESDIYIYSEDNSVSVTMVAVDFTKFVVGDVSGDGGVTAADAALLLKHLSSGNVLTDTLKYGDHNIDGSIDIKDVIAILNYVEENKYNPEKIEVDTSDGTEVSSYSGLTAALKSEGAKIYVTDDIKIGDRIQMNKGGQSIIGVPKADGSLPVLDFADMSGRNDIINYASSDSDVGIKIRSGNNTIENLVIENAHDNGILLKRENADPPVTGNKIKNCIFRYNNDSGLQITKGADNTTVENVISYRNCDVFTRGSNADGFAVKMGAGIDNTTDTTAIANNPTTFINCYAWENGDDGWDSYDKAGQDQQTYNVVYKNCMCWGNGTPSLHLGYRDYINGLELDENLPFIKRIAVTNPTGYERFKIAYNNRTLCSASASKEEYGAAVDAILNKKINTDRGELSVTELLDPYNWAGNPNGFKLGSAYTEDICQRTLINCITFDHGKKGFDRNNAACNVSLKNCIAFGNVRNYKLDEMNITGYENVLGWSGTDSDNMPSSYTIAVPDDYSTMESEIRTTARAFVRYAAQGQIAKTDVYDVLFP